MFQSPDEHLVVVPRSGFPGDPAYELMFRIVSLPDLVEAAVSTGDAALAREQLGLVTEATKGWRTTVIEGALGLAKVILADESALDGTRRNGAGSHVRARERGYSLRNRGSVANWASASAMAVTR